MRHTSIERYTNLDSVVHRIDPRIKILTFIPLILFVVSTPQAEFQKFFLYLIIISLIILASRIPPKFIFRRTMVVIPFILIIGISVFFVGGGGVVKGDIVNSYSLGSMAFNISYGRLRMFYTLMAKSYLSILVMTTMVSATGPVELIKGFRKLKLPVMMVILVSLMYRYIPILSDEVIRMKRARDSRSPTRARLWYIKTIGNIVGTLFIRSYERCERIHAAMVSRGFTGEMDTIDNFRIRKQDILFLTIFYLAVMIVVII